MSEIKPNIGNIIQSKFLKDLGSRKIIGVDDMLQAAASIGYPYFEFEGIIYQVTFSGCPVATPTEDKVVGVNAKSPMSQDQYLKVDGFVCPFCISSENLEWDQPDPESEKVFTDVRCKSCYAEWVDQYKLERYFVKRAPVGYIVDQLDML